MAQGQVRFADTTDNSRTVRRKADPTAGNIATMSPLTCAEATIISSSSSLHLGIANLLQSLGKDFVKAMHELQVKCNKITKMEDDSEYQPISTRINFKLQAMDAIKDTEGFNDLQAKVDDTLSKLKMDLKSHIIECAKLEKAALRERAQTLAVSLVKSLVTIYSIAHGIDKYFVHNLAQKAIRDKGNTFLTHMQLTPDEFVARYNTEFNCAEENIVLPEKSDELVKGVSHCLLIVMKTSWDAYLTQVRHNEINTSIKKCAKDILQSQATEDAVMQLDAEPSLSRSQMDELISAQAKKEVQRQMAALEKKLKAGRGNDVSASIKKKKANGEEQETKPKPSKQKKVKGKGKNKVDDGNNGTEGAKQGSKTKRSTKQKEKTKQDGNKKKEASSGKSKRK